MKRSLHTGLNFVDGQGYYQGWDGLLRACCNDAESMSNAALLMGYSNPVVLFDKSVMLDNLQSELLSAAAISEDGDWFFWSHSGHGGTNGSTQTICLYDQEMADWQIHNAVCRFKSGVNIVLFFDNCYAGGDFDRALFRRVRGMHQKVAERLPDRPSIGPRDEVKANVVVMAACKDTETASDGYLNGEWTGNALATFKPCTHMEWFRNAAAGTTGQTPQLMMRGVNPELILNSKLTT